MDLQEWNGYHVGQVVMIREWDDLVDEFGFEFCDIVCGDLNFLEEMKQYCGMKVTLAWLSENRVGFVENTGPWEFNYNMIQTLATEIEENLALDEEFVMGIENLI